MIEITPKGFEKISKDLDMPKKEREKIQIGSVTHCLRNLLVMVQLQQQCKTRYHSDKEALIKYIVDQEEEWFNPSIAKRSIEKALGEGYITEEGGE